MNKIAICGYTSSTGKYFIKRYKNNYNFLLLGRSNPDIFVDLSIPKITGDLNLLKKCDAIINFSAQTNNTTFYDIQNMLKTNILGPLFLANLAVENDISRFIHISSISAQYSDDNPFYSYYSQSKKYADNLLSFFCNQKKLSYCVLRPSALFGTDDFSVHQKLLYQIINCIKQGKDITLFGTKNSKRNYIHVETLSEIISKLIYSDVKGIYPVINMKNNSLTEIIDALNDNFNGKSKAIFDCEKPDIYPCELYDSGQIFDLLNIPKPNGMKGELRKHIEL